MMKDKDLELENKNHETALCIAIVAGNLETIKILVERNKRLLTIPSADAYMMPLSTAALYGHYDVVEYLYERSNDLCDEDGWDLPSRSLLLEKCVQANMFGMALNIVEIYPHLESRPVLLSLAQNPEVFDETESDSIVRAIYSIFWSGGLTVGAYKHKNESLQLLRSIWGKTAKKHKNEIDTILRGPPDSENLIHALPLQKLISEHLGKLDVETKNILGGSPIDNALKLQELISEHLENIDVQTKKLIEHDYKRFFCNGDQSSELQKLIHDHVVNIRVEFQNIIKQKQISMEDQVSYLQNFISKHVAKMRALAGLDIKKYSSRIPFIAAEMGNTKFLIELISLHPDLIWKVNDDKQTIFHIAVKYRHQGIYSLLYEMGSIKDLITSLRDVDGNNMLHLAGMKTTKGRLGSMSGAALHMQSELLWFKEIESTIPPSFKEQKNKGGLTPAELFIDEHKELIRQGEKAAKETATQFIVGAALIATITFAAAFTVPGGFQDNGNPVFYRKTLFNAFVVTDAMSLMLSSVSILTLLSMFTTRYTEIDFVRSLPLKLLLGMSTFFLSIIFMILSFSVSLFVLYRKQYKWIPVMIAVFAYAAVYLFTVFQYPLFFDVIVSTYSSRHSNFKPKKQYLNNVNPKF